MHQIGTIFALAIQPRRSVRSVTLTLFRISKGKQKITKDDWRNYLIDHDISFTEDELKFFITHYEFQSDATLNQYDFL